MNDHSQSSNCDAESIHVAWKLFLRGYASEGAAIRALRRRRRGLSATDASSHLRQASALLEGAIRVLKPHQARLHAIYMASGKITPEDMASFVPELVTHFPDSPDDALRTALQAAMTFHMR